MTAPQTFLGVPFHKWADFVIKTDLARIDSTIRAGILGGKESAQIARETVEAARITRNQLLHLRHVATKPLRKRKS